MEKLIPRNNTSFIKSAHETIKQIQKDKNDPLKYHQRIIHDYVLKYPHIKGILAFWEMGAGKTLLAVSLCESLLQQKKFKRILFISSKTLHGNFVGDYKKYLKMINSPMSDDEMNKHIYKNCKFITLTANNMLQQVFRSTKVDSTDAMNDSFEQILLKDEDESKVKKILEEIKKSDSTGNLDDSFVVIDEAHNFFNGVTNGSKNYIGLYNALMTAKNNKILYLTGSPITNDPFEVALGFNTLQGYFTTKNSAGKEEKLSLFGDSYDDFRKFFVTYPYADLVESNEVTEDNEHSNKRKMPIPIIKNAEKFSNRIVGLVSYYGTDQQEIKDLFPTLEELIVERVPMSIKQYSAYSSARDKEQEETKKSIFKQATKPLQKPQGVSSSYRVRSRQISNFLYPKYASRTYKDDRGFVKYEKFIEKLKPNCFNVYVNNNKNLKQVKNDIKKEPKELKSKEPKEHKEKKNKNKKSVKGKYEGSDEDKTPKEEPIKEEDTIKEEETTEEDNNLELEKMDTTKNSKEQKKETKDQSLDIKDQEENDEKEDDEFGLETWSPKLAKLLVNLSIHLPKGMLDYFKDLSKDSFYTPELILNKSKIGVGPGIVYSQFVDSGVALVGKILKQHGMVQINENNIKNSAINPKGTFAIISGDVDAEFRSEIVKLAMSSDNKNGSLLSVLLITATGAEGISTKNMRHVHAIDPFWHWARLSQVFSRAARLGSHLDLDPSNRTVQPYLYLSDYPLVFEDKEQMKIKSVEDTTDVTLYFKAIQNRILIDSFERKIKEASIDCSIHYSGLSNNQKKQNNQDEQDIDPKNKKVKLLKNSNLVCKMCQPTNEPLFINDLAIDIKTPSTCRTLKEEKIKATAISIEDANGKRDYMYTFSDSSGSLNQKDLKKKDKSENLEVFIFKFEPDLNAYQQIYEDNPDYYELYNKILKLNAKK